MPKRAITWCASTSTRPRSRACSKATYRSTNRDSTTLVKRNFEKGRLTFTTDAAEGVRHGLFQFIAVGTPPEEDGSADLSHVLAVAETIGRHMTEYRIVVDKSTVPVGTADKVRERIEQTLGERGEKVEFDVVSNPEFLKEGAAIADFMKPDRVVVGTDNPRTAELLKTLYDPFTRSRDRMIVMDVRSAELTKYAANAMLATKISFMNEMANLAERMGADIEKVRVGIGSDPRIGYSFIYPGAGYGGSCFPKDVKALVHSASEYGFDAKLLKSVEAVNRNQKQVLFQKVQRVFRRAACAARRSRCGASRSSRIRTTCARRPRASSWKRCGPRARRCARTTRSPWPRRSASTAGVTTLNWWRTPTRRCEGADALVIVTEWQEFRSPDFDVIRDRLAHPAVFDGRNIYDPALVRSFGLHYHGIGRGEHVAY